LNSNEFVIFDTFKNLLNKGKDKQLYNNTNSLSVSISSAMETINTGNNLNLYLSHNQNNIYTMTPSPIKSNSSIIGNDKFNKDNIQIETLSFQITNNEDTNKNTTKTDANMKNCNCTFYKKKYQKFKKLYETNKKNFIKEKKNSDMMSFKFLYEKYEMAKSNSQSNNEKSSELMSKFEDEVKVSKMLYDKLQDNNLLFEKLENEIYNKNIIINKQNETLKHQKQTIDKLLEQFRMFSNQGNYLANDLLILKQNIYDKNFKEVSQELDAISSNIDEYTSKIKNFSEKSKDLITHQVDSENKKLITIDEVNAEPTNIIFNDEKSDFYIQTNEDLIEGESGLFSLTRSNIRTSINKNDKSLNIFELSNN
jgi:hypothetical protein